MTTDKRELLQTILEYFEQDWRADHADLWDFKTETKEHIASELRSLVTVPIERLEEIVSALDRGLGDSDITHIESDEELKEEEPIQWACSQLNHMIAAAPKEVNRWQPIETAPHGRSVLCYWPPVHKNDINYDAYIGEAWCRFGNWFRTRDGYGAPSREVNTPTHWSELPTAPKEGE